MKARYLAPLALVALGACSNDGVEGSIDPDLTRPTVATTAAPRETAPAPLTDEEIEIIAIATSFNQHRDELCPPWNNLIANGVPRATLEDMAVREISAGMGEQLSPAAEAELLRLLETC